MDDSARIHSGVEQADGNNATAVLAVCAARALSNDCIMQYESNQSRGFDELLRFYVSFVEISNQCHSLVSICDVCSFAEQKKYSVNLGETREEVYEKLRPLGLVYQTISDTPDLYQVDEIHAALLKIYNGTYPLRQIMDNVSVEAPQRHFICETLPCSQLAPKCSDLIRYCMWRGSVVNCSHYFEQRHSFIGLCCYFNYQRPHNEHVM